MNFHKNNNFLITLKQLYNSNYQNVHHKNIFLFNKVSFEVYTINNEWNKQSFGGSTTDYSKAMIQPNFTQRNKSINQNFVLVPQNQQLILQFGFHNQKIYLVKKISTKHNKQFQSKDLITNFNSNIQQLIQIVQHNIKQYYLNNAALSIEMSQDFLPQEILFLLSEENNHLDKMKQQVDKEKAKIIRQVSSIKNAIVIERLC